MTKKPKKKVKLHIKWKGLFLIVLITLLFFLVGYSFLHLPVKRILILGNEKIKEYEIIEIAGLKEFPTINKYSIRTLENNIRKLDLVSKVKVKKSIFGKITIEMEEARVLFYNRNHSSYVLSNGKETIHGNFHGIPFLISEVKNDVYERLIKELSEVKTETLSLISEIEYSPSRSGEVVLDDTRFLLRMNDGNQVYINLLHMDRLDMYALTYTTLMEKGTLYLDSDNNSAWFRKFGE